MRKLSLDAEAAAVLEFWFSEGPNERREAWFKKNPAFDEEIRQRFGGLHSRAAAGELDGWTETARGRLALIVVLDQFSRNMFRGDPRAFSTDAKALELAREGVEQGYDRDLSTIERDFMYLPFEHSEDLADQHRAVELFENSSSETAEYARQHLAVIEKFGRFPHRNAVLSRENTPEETEYLKDPNAGF